MSKKNFKEVKIEQKAFDLIEQKAKETGKTVDEVANEMVEKMEVPKNFEEYKKELILKFNQKKSEISSEATHEWVIRRIPTYIGLNIVNFIDVDSKEVDPKKVSDFIKDLLNFKRIVYTPQVNKYSNMSNKEDITYSISFWGNEVLFKNTKEFKYFIIWFTSNLFYGQDVDWLTNGFAKFFTSEFSNSINYTTSPYSKMCAIFNKQY